MPTSAPVPVADGGAAARRKRIAQVLAAIRAKGWRGPFWIGTAGHYLRAHGRAGLRLWLAVPHTANPLSPLSPTIRSAAYAHNRLCREWTSRGPEAERELVHALDEALQDAGPGAPGTQPTPEPSHP